MMENLGFRKYCLIGLGNVSGVIDMIKSVSETEVAYVSGSGLIITTFMSAFNISEIEIMLNDEEKSYILFEMSPGFYSANIRDKKFQKTLFGGPVDNTSLYQNIADAIEGLKNIEMDFGFMDGDDIPFIDIDKFINRIPSPNNEKDEDPDIDDILDRINEIGFENLTNKEKVLLEKYSKK